MVKVRANIRFKDKEWGEIWRAQGDVWNVDVDRAWQLTQTKHNQNYFCDYDELKPFYIIFVNIIKTRTLLFYIRQEKVSV